MTLFVTSNGNSHCRLGVAATRKLGSAVVRNRAKRLARELFRRQKPVAGLDIVLVPRREMLDAPFASLCVANRLSAEVGAGAVQSLLSLSLVQWDEARVKVALTERGMAQMNQLLQRVALSA